MKLCDKCMTKEGDLVAISNPQVLQLAGKMIGQSQMAVVPSHFEARLCPECNRKWYRTLLQPGRQKSFLDWLDSDPEEVKPLGDK